MVKGLLATWMQVDGHCTGGWAPGHSVGCEQAETPDQGRRWLRQGELVPGEVCALVAPPRGGADTGPHGGPN